FAGMLAMLSPDVYSDPERYSNTQLALDMLAFGFILYNQFAGYTNIVRGVSGLFGLELARNFRQPFFSQDFSDFWTRWHISLSQWLRDYVYMPVSRSLLRRNPSRTNKANLFVPPLATMLASGLARRQSKLGLVGSDKWRLCGRRANPFAVQEDRSFPNKTPLAANIGRCYRSAAGNNIGGPLSLPSGGQQNPIG
ncbi:MAG: hypothetical protein OEZ02_11645, partial [Anaerolineae bacterium]|nr:hypothetical protein [Anaerolineae bacterium]